MAENSFEVMNSNLQVVNTFHLFWNSFLKYYHIQIIITLLISLIYKLITKLVVNFLYAISQRFTNS